MSGEFRALSLVETLAALLKPQPTLVLLHVNPDADAIGSAFALASFLSATGSPAYCLGAEEIPQRLRFLTDGLQDSILPESMPAEFADARVIAVDTASPAQLGRLYQMFGERISLMIDHHAQGEPYADHLIQPHAAAAGEIVFDLIAESGVDVPPVCAKLLYAAISSDTGGFRYSNVTHETHLRAAVLLQCDIDVAEISRLLFETKTPEVLRAERAGLENLRLIDGGRIALIPLSYQTLCAAKVSAQHLSTVVDVARSVAGAEVAVFIRQPSEAGVFRVSMRANVDFDVSAVCATFGGGGHTRAAGATVVAENIDAACDAVIAAIRAQGK